MEPKVFALYTLLSVIWGTTWIVLKISLDGTPPILGVALRFSISATILWLTFLLRKEKLVLSRTAIKVYLGFGCLNFACAYSLTYWGTQFIYSGLSAVLWASLPILVALGAHFALPEEPLTGSKVLGGLTGLLGTFLIFSHRGEAPEDFRIIGVVAVMIAVVIATWPNIIYKRHQREVPPLHLNVVAQSIAVMLLFPASFLLEDPSTMVWDLTNISALLYLAIFGTVVTWSIYFWLYAHLTVTQITAVALLPPVFAILLGWVLLSEALTPKMIAGSILVLLGVLMVNRQKRSVEKGRRPA